MTFYGPNKLADGEQRWLPRHSESYLARLNSIGWKMLRWFCFRLTWGRDCTNPRLPAQQLDHLHYRNLWHELPLRDVVPLSARTHQRVTADRKRLGRKLVNPPLQAAFGLWLALDAILCGSIFHVARALLGL